MERGVLSVSSTPLDSLCGRLNSRRGEIERATLSRVYGVSDPASTDDPEYVVGLRTAVSAALSCGIAAIDRKDVRSLSIPPELTAQARHAARNEISLETVLRRYFAGYALLCDFILEEARRLSSAPGVELRDVLRTEAALLDRLVVAVTAEYAEEAEGRFPRSTEQRRTQQVKDLLAGELIDTSDLRYSLDAWHLGGIAVHSSRLGAIRDAATALGCSVLIAQPDEVETWFWLGGKRRLSSREVIRVVRRILPPDTSLTVGEPRCGAEGWRETHRQALAAMPVALRSSVKNVRYVDVALVASALRDDVLMRSLQDLYISPLNESRDGGRTFRRTLRAYFESDRTVSSAAALLGVSRRTVANRLQAIEDRLGRPLGSCAAELEAALQLAALEDDDLEDDDLPLTERTAASQAAGAQTEKHLAP